MQWRAALALLALATMTATPSCSLVVSDLHPGECSMFDDCDGLNHRDGLDALTCELWTCDMHDHFCHRRSRDRDGDGSFGPYPPATTCAYTVSDCDDEDARRAIDRSETCDAIDNDCDLIIDETFVDSDVPAFVTSAPLGPFTMGDGTSPTQIAFPASQDPTARTALVARLTAGRFVAERVGLEGAAGTAMLGYEFACGIAMTTQGCVTNPGCTGSPLTCELGEPALDVLGSAETWLAAANSIGCSAGGSDVRVGVLRNDRLSQRGDTVAGSPSCASGPASRPTLAALDTGVTSLALVTYLAEPASTTRACGTPVAVRAIVVRENVMDLDVWSGPFDLGMTSGTSSASVVALGSSGWAVAFAAASGTSLVFVPSSMGATTGTPIGTLGSDAPGEVRIAGRIVSGMAELGVLRVGGCSGGALTFGTVRFDPAQPATGVTMRAPAMIAPSATAAALVRVDEAFVVPGFMRGAVTATADTVGGWVAGWSDAASGGAAHARRILAMDGAPVGDTIDLPGDAGTSAWLARAAATSGHVVDQFVLRPDRTLARASLLCR